MTSLANGLPIGADLPPLRVDEGGAVRVGKTRISLDLIVEQYENGMTPEDMVRAYDTLMLADVYAPTSDEEEDVETQVRSCLVASGNTYNPSLLVLRQKGYELWL